MEQYRRKNFLINKKFQLRYCFYVCSWLFTLSFVYPFIIYEIFDYFLRYLAIQSPGHSPNELEMVRRQLIWLLASLQAVFLAVTFLISIFVSHRIAGPIDKLHRWLIASKDGVLKDALSFRKADYFSEIAGAYNKVVSSVFGIVDGSLTRLEKAADQSSGSAKKEIQEAIDELKKIHLKTSKTGPSFNEPSVTAEHSK